MTRPSLAVQEAVRAAAARHRQRNGEECACGWIVTWQVPHSQHVAEAAAAAALAAQGWDDLIDLLDQHWPEKVFPTVPDHPLRDPGPRIVALLRWVARFRRQQARLYEAAEDWEQHGYTTIGLNLRKHLDPLEENR